MTPIMAGNNTANSTANSTAHNSNNSDYNTTSTTIYLMNGISFSDVSKNHWAYNAVKKLSSSQSSNQMSLPANNVEGIPTQITIEGRTYSMKSYIWRDFMPISPSSGKGMIASIRLIAQDDNPIPSNLVPDKLWIINPNQDEVWETAFSDEPRFSPGTVEIVARGGPKWEPGIMVDVVIRIPSNDNGDTYFLRLPNQTIQRTS